MIATDWKKFYLPHRREQITDRIMKFTSASSRSSLVVRELPVKFLYIGPIVLRPSRSP